MTEIFFIAYQFPPLNVGGVFRPLKFVKYFNDFGIKPIIFTLSPDDFPKIYKNKKPDNKLLKDIQNVEKEIIHVNSDELLNTRKNKFQSFIQIYFNVTKSTEHKKWKNHFFKAAEQELKRHSPKAIVVTAPPFGVIEFAVQLSKKTDIPLIIDMRDSLSMWISQPYGSYLHYIFTLKNENRWFKHATKIIAVTQQMINDWKLVHKNIPESKFQVIANGFDDDINFSKLIISPVDKVFTIGYVGSFYYNPENRDMMFKPWIKKRLHHKLQYIPRKEDWLYRSPYFLFKTLDNLFKKKTHYKDKIFIKMVGLKPNWFDKMLAEFDLENNVEHIGFLSFEKSIAFQKKCDALLLTSVKVIEGEDYCIAGKSFDYITMRKPIIGFVTEGAQKEFIKNSGLGIVCNPDDIAKSVEVLEDLFEKGVELKPNKPFIEKYHRKNITEQLSEIILSL